MPATDAPRGELGAPGVATVGGLLETYEDTRELAFPLNFRVFDAMRRDSQLDAILRAIFLPILALADRGGIRLEGADVDPARIEACRQELGLGAGPGEVRARRRRNAVVFRDVLRYGLLSLPFGMMPLEQVYDVAPPYPGQGLQLPLVAHVDKLAPRMPRSLTKVTVARDGGLTSVTQQTLRRDGQPGWEEVELGVDRLVVFVNEREGGDWLGRSIFRSAYPHWLIKQRLMRLGPVIVERNGMGVPVVRFTEGGSEAKALKIAKAFRAGEESGVALPEGYTLELVTPNGRPRDELPLLNYHDQAAGRGSLAMFLNLGHDNGARSLGDTFVDYFVLAENATVGEVLNTLTEYVVRDWFALNFGVDEPYPALVADPVNAEATPTAEALAALAKQNLLGPLDPGLHADVRRRYGLPPLPAIPGIDGDVELPLDDVDDVEEGGDVVPLRPPAGRAAAGAAELAQRAATIAQRAAALAAAEG